MKKRFKKVIPTLILMSLVIPQITFAAWYNPFSWWGKEQSAREESEISESKFSNTSPIKSASLNEIDKSPLSTQIIKADNLELQAKINTLLKRNAEMQAQLNSCLMQTKQTTMSQPVKISTTAQDEQKIKLESIDRKILQLVNENLNVVGLVKENGERLTCEEVAQRMRANNFGSTTLIGQSFEKNCKLPVEQINHLLDAYRLVDTKMTHKDITSVVDLAELKKYLVDLYIKYR